MKILCAWCVQKGLPGDLGEQAPFDNPRISHGMCDGHLVELRAELARLKRPETFFA